MGVLAGIFWPFLFYVLVHFDIVYFLTFRYVVTVLLRSGKDASYGFRLQSRDVCSQLFTHVILSPSCIIWCWLNGGDALQLGCNHRLH